MTHIMKHALSPLAAAALAAGALLAGCGPQDGEAVAGAQPTAVAQAAPQARPAPPAARPAVDRSSVGAVIAVEPIVTRDDPSGAGAVIGGVVGAAIGNQVGSGNGRKAATVVGAIGGAAAGHEIEKRRSEQVTGYRVAVRLDDGSTRSFTLARADAYAVGQRVRIVNGALRPA
jgi:outer membrane lipoprotein SlyB